MNPLTAGALRQALDGVADSRPVFVDIGANGQVDALDTLINGRTIHPVFGVESGFGVSVSGGQILLLEL